jgi:hypothetical protein
MECGATWIQVGEGRRLLKGDRSSQVPDGEEVRFVTDWAL